MATNVATAGGTTVSFSNTSQAQGDSFVATNDTYSLDTILKFDVMANDLGGGAKSLYSVDGEGSASTGTKVPAPADLLDSDKDHALEAADFGCQIQVTADGQFGVKLTQDFLDHMATIDADHYETINFTYAIQLGNGTLSWATVSIGFQGTHVVTPPDDDAPDPATALSHGYWMTHPLSGSEGFAAAVGGTSFDDFFNLDAPIDRTWVDQSTGGQNPTIANLADLTFERAVAFGNGAGAPGDTTSPAIAGDFQDLVREAATAVLNFYDADHSASFVDWYIYERNHNDNDGVIGNNPTDATSVLADLKAQVDATISGDAGAYSVDALATILHATHHDV
ncbi:hypothetical protein [Mesorhizobium sp. M1396]|uniref:hypothetical protein n=1 Tax=Mesorhizobium sp. M1396 TaxID=2957095 RepID=UPI00333A8687